MISVHEFEAIGSISVVNKFHKAIISELLGGYEVQIMRWIWKLLILSKRPPLRLFLLFWISAIWFINVIHSNSCNSCYILLFIFKRATCDNCFRVILNVPGDMILVRLQRIQSCFCKVRWTSQCLWVGCFLKEYRQQIW